MPAVHTILTTLPAFWARFAPYSRVNRAQKPMDTRTA